MVPAATNIRMLVCKRTFEKREDMDTSQAFGQFIAEHRTQQKLAMRQFAGMIGITAPYLSDIEKGHRAAPENKLEDIATALHLTSTEREMMFDLAALTRENRVPVDLAGYLMETDKAREALRRAKERHLNDQQWQHIIDIIVGAEH